jgi:hypothetical protein
MKRFVYILIGLSTFITGVLLIPNGSNNAENVIVVNNQQIYSNTISIPQTIPRFQQLDDKRFGLCTEFQLTSGSKRVYLGYFTGEGNVQDISVCDNTAITYEGIRRAFKGCKKGKKNFVERSFRLNEKGEKTGERCSLFYPKGASIIYLTEGEEHWSITSTSLEVATEFENSEEFLLWKSHKTFKE